ncbi:MAG: hypothetical protein S4CHLAM37_14710 [Chlamydiia bacterium]|nr:hypothetical protein [Chlamydiia bacterium]
MAVPAAAPPLSSTFLKMPIMVSATHYRNPHNGKTQMIHVGERVSPSTHVITKCCNRAILKAELKHDHDRHSTCEETIPTDLNESHRLKDRATDRRLENAAEAKIVRINIGYGRWLEVPINPFTNHEINEVTDPLTFDSFKLHEGHTETPADNEETQTTCNAHKFFKDRLVTQCGTVFKKKTFLGRARTQDLHTCPNQNSSSYSRCKRTLHFEGHTPEPSTLSTTHTPTYGTSYYNAPAYTAPAYTPPEPGTGIFSKQLLDTALGVSAVATGVIGYISLVALSTPILGVTLLAAGLTFNIFSMICSNEIKDEEAGNWKFTFVANNATSSLAAFAGCTFLGASTTVTGATVVASVAIPIIYHLANMYS